MRYSPSAEERAAFNEMSDEDRFHYATTRIVECEEVWSLGDDNGWLIQDRGEDLVISIWPYKEMAVDAAVDTLSENSPISVSLEHFLYGLLDQCKENGIHIEVNPKPAAQGHIIPAHKLYEVLSNIVDSESYFVEG